MIFHFIKRDYNTYRFFWIIIGVFSVVSIPAVLVSGKYFMPVAYAYLFFGIIPIKDLIGVTWRSQHIMSRNYILALPVKRKKLFFMIQYRALIYWLPFLILSWIAPLFLSDSILRKESENSYLIYALMIILGVIWFINSSITMQLACEKISSYLTQKQRAKEWIKLMVVYLGEFAIVGISFLSILGISFHSSYIDTVHISLPLLIVLALVSIRFYLAKKRWLGQQ